MLHRRIWMSVFAESRQTRCALLQLICALFLSDAYFPSTSPGADVVVHVAGPFQRRRTNPVLEAAIAKRVAYIDVADDSEFAKLSRKTYAAAAREARPRAAQEPRPTRRQRSSCRPLPTRYMLAPRRLPYRALALSLLCILVQQSLLYSSQRDLLCPLTFLPRLPPHHCPLSPPTETETRLG